MKEHRNVIMLGVLAATLVQGGLAHAGTPFDTMDIDPKFRARIAKERVKQNTTNAMNSSSRTNQDGDDCGSQNIGNINTGGRPGTAPREVVIFAPNAVNVVSGRGCR
jgi:hypothetical protein